MTEGTNKNREVNPCWEESAEEHYSFDELASGLASGTISRRRALKLAGAAFLSATLIPLLPGVAEAQARCPRKKRPGCSRQCRGVDFSCICVKTTEGTKTCVHPCCGVNDIPVPCTSSADCASGQVCSTTASNCCGTATPICVTPCDQPNLCVAGASTRSAGDGTWNLDAA
jgi:Cys-rich repeat protein